MKKSFLLLSLVLSTALSAQIDFRSTKIGVTAAGNYSRVNNSHNPSGPRYTFQAGVIGMIPVDRYNQFYIQPEVLYYGAGESGRQKDLKKDWPGYDAVYANNYISVPIYFKGYFSEGETTAFGMIGPKFNFLVNQKIENPSNPIYTKEGLKNNPSLNGKANGFNFGIGLGLGFSYKRKIELTAKYDFGLSNTYPHIIQPEDKNTEKKKSEQVFSIGLSYIFN